jgi:hypothetical protein
MFFIVGSPKGTDAPEPRNIRICFICYEQYGHTLFDFIQKTAIVINGFSDLILTLDSSEVGRHARSAIGVKSLPMGFLVIIEVS